MKFALHDNKPLRSRSLWVTLDLGSANAFVHTRLVKYSIHMFAQELISQGRIQDFIRGGAPDCDRPKTAILGPQFCRILVLGPHFWWSGGGARAPRAPLDPPLSLLAITKLPNNELTGIHTLSLPLLLL